MTLDVLMPQDTLLDKDLYQILRCLIMKIEAGGRQPVRELRRIGPPGIIFHIDSPGCDGSGECVIPLHPESLIDLHQDLKRAVDD